MASPRAQVPPIIGGFPSSSAPTGHETDTEVFEDAEDAADFAARKEDILSERNRLIRTQLLMREQSGDDSKAVSHAMAPSKRYASPVPKPASTVQNANTKAVQSQQSQTLKLRRVFAPSNKMSQFMSSLTGRKPSLLSDPTPAHVSRESLISSAPGLQSHTSYAPSLDQTPHLSQATHASSESHHAPSSYQHQRHQPSMSASEGLYRVHSVPAPQAPAPYIARQPASQVPVGSQSSVYHPLPEPIYTRYLVQSAESLAHGVSETFVDQHGNLYESVGNISSQDLYTPVSDATTAFLSQQTQLYRPFPQTYQPPQQVYPTPYRPAPHILSNQYPQYARRTEIEQVYQEQNAFENEFESQQHLYASADIVADSAELYASEGRDEVPELGQYRVSETQREEGVSWVVVQGRDENGVLVATDASQNTDRYVQGIDGSVGDSMRYLNVVE
ncbi:hypothetical protein BC830DRAFT_297674 [Chytriomyces sp. MP71]|nr:hypothetical protein BC830DRAFT_297674 [Chytriomyces sp. MP71]